MRTNTLQPQLIVGSVRRFGEKGVLYEVIRKVNAASAVIRVIDTGEEALYPIADILKDPTR